MTPGSRPAVFLDRDGVLNHTVIRDGVPVSPRAVEDFRLIDSAMQGVRDLKAAGFVCVVVTNQPDVGRGLLAETDLSAMHEILLSTAALDAIYVCAHGRDDECDCRKPRPGLVLRASQELHLDLDRSWLVGDRWVDIGAANAVGVRAILVENNFSFRPTSTGPVPESLDIYQSVADLRTAVPIIVHAPIP